MSQVKIEVLKKAADLCVESYKNTPSVGTIHVWDNAQVLLHEDGEVLWVVARGTDEFPDVKDDTCGQREYPQGFCVHKGFYAYAKKCWLAIQGLPVFQNAVSRNRRIILTGHSLGGAAALLMPLIEPKMINRTARIQHIITFGSPRPFNGGTNPLNHPYYGKILRIIRQADIVPDTPLWGSLPAPLAASVSGWSHVGNEMFLQPGKLREEGRSRIQNWVMRLMRYTLHLPVYLTKFVLHKIMRSDKPRSLLVRDHSMVTYQNEISLL